MPLDLPMLRVIAQRGESDCTIAALAMYLGKTYEDVLEAASAQTAKPHRRGMWSTDIIRTAKRLGTTLVAHRTFDLEQDTGILSGMITDTQPGHVRARIGHAVVLRWGLIIDPAYGELWEPDTYAAHYRARWSRLLTRENLHG